MKDKKAWYLSRTLWVNFGIAMLPLLIENFEIIRSIVPDSIYGILLFGAVIINGFLRFITTQGLTSK